MADITSLPVKDDASSLLDSQISELEKILKDYCKQMAKESEAIGPSAAKLWQEIEECISSGKRLRPRIFLMTYAFYNGSQPELVLPVACSLELLHASLLIHDDIIDRDIIRHGKLNIAGKYQESYALLTNHDVVHYAQSAALLAGDLLISSAYDIINRSSLSDSQKLAAQKYLQQAIFAVGGGELIDTESVLYPISEVDPYSIAINKTASYSFQLPMECGAMLAGATTEELSKLRKIGQNVGIAFQLQDDLLGVFGDSNKTGKSNRSDIFEKKRTLLIQYVLKSVSSKDAERLNQLYSSSQVLTEAEAEEVYGIIASTTARDDVLALVKDYSEHAVKVIDSLDIDSIHKKTLSDFTYSLIGRSV